MHVIEPSIANQPQIDDQNLIKTSQIFTNKKTLKNKLI